MNEPGAIIPIPKEQAELLTEIVKAFSGVGSFFKNALGSVPSDLVGYFGGDWLRLRRIESIAKMMERTHEVLQARGVEYTEPVSLTLALPILRGAADESREELRDLWARLLAAALDPARTGSVRQGFAEAISKMDAIDALVLTSLKEEVVKREGRAGKAQQLGISFDEIETSIWHLGRLELTSPYTDWETHTTAFGRELLRAVSD